MEGMFRMLRVLRLGRMLRGLFLGHVLLRYKIEVTKFYHYWNRL